MRENRNKVEKKVNLFSNRYVSGYLEKLDQILLLLLVRQNTEPQVEWKNI